MSDLSGLTSNQFRAHLAMERPKKSLLYRLFKCAVVVSAGFLALTGNPLALLCLWIPFIGVTIWRFSVVAKGIQHNGRAVGRANAYFDGFGIFLTRTVAQGFVVVVLSIITMVGAGKAKSPEQRAQEAAELKKDRDKRAPNLCNLYFDSMGKPGFGVIWKGAEWCDAYPQYDKRTGIDRQATTASTRSGADGLWK